MKCEICLINDAKHTCRLCGRHVCDDDYDSGSGLCLACKDTSCYICGVNLAVALCASCGRPICRRHSVRVGLRRYCINCAKALGLAAPNQAKVNQP